MCQRTKALDSETWFDFSKLPTLNILLLYKALKAIIVQS
jgi:hypothetical protein